MFAKRLQHWRAIVSKADGHVVSSNVAPASNTTSVLKNPLLAAAFGGASLISPLYIFDPSTSNALMTYLLLHDLNDQTRRNDLAPPCPTPNLPPPPLDDDSHPLMLFASTAVHNGVWRCAYQLRSILEAVVLVQYSRRYGSQVAIGACATAAAASVILRARL